MATGMIDVIKRASMNAVENGKPCDLRFGTVISENPLKVQITSDLIIPESLLVVPEHLTDYSVNVNVGVTEFTKSTVYVSGETLIYGSTEEEAEPVDERTLTIYNSLKKNDKVALVRNQGGKVYYILDRV